MVTNELKKGDMVMQRNGWKARIEDNKMGNTRLATVYGDFTELGSIYSHDITYKLNGEGTEPTKIEHTPAQIKLKERVTAMGF